MVVAKVVVWGSFLGALYHRKPVECRTQAVLLESFSSQLNSKETPTIGHQQFIHRQLAGRSQCSGVDYIAGLLMALAWQPDQVTLHAVP